ncbi:MAG TPA: thioredoxin fold domain-containing protein [Chitinophagaceae bacterium]|nr:thioredoxin fold domain-containing protein [Chitinophagaceae bacterium]
MKRSYLLILLLSFYFIGYTQADSTEAPYKRFPAIPPFKLLLTDSNTYVTKDDLEKKKPVMIMLFSPDCEHCKHETEDIIRNMNAFKKIQIVMATTLPFDKMVDFYNKYDLKRFDNIVVGRDVSYFFPVFYNIRNLPFLAFYDKKKELISVFSGALPVEKVIEELKK